MKRIATIVVLGAVLSATPAYADMFCVQRALSNLGYEPGPVDGAFGGKTASAAAAYATDFSVSLATLDKTNSAPWCEALTATAATPEGIARRFDVTSPPQGLMSEAATQRMWDLYKNQTECLAFDAGLAGTGKSFPLSVQPAQAFASGPAWKSPYTAAIGTATCETTLPAFAAPPAAIPVVTLDEGYGQRVADVENAMKWFQRASTYVRFSGDPVARMALKNAIVDWAKNDSLGRGIRVSWGNRPIDYQMGVSVMTVVAATAEIIPDMSADERGIVGAWLNKLVKVAADSHWQDASDNKALMTAYIATLWGIMVEDSAAVRAGIEAYKLALHMMRPDGSFPVDSQRGGMGIQYSSYNTTYLLQVASAVQHAYGIDLFGYSADGRSIHDAVDFLVRSIKTPGETNAIYALSCPDSGDRWGTITEPSTGFFDDASTLLLYADQFPDSANAPWILESALDVRGSIQLSEHAGGVAACQFAAPTNAVFTGEPIKIEGLLVLPPPKYELDPSEVSTHKIGMDVKVNSQMFSEINIPEARAEYNGLQKVGFNIVGRYDFLGKTFSELALLFGQNLDVANLDAIRACGRDFDIETWDDGSYHLVVKLRKMRKEFTAPDLSCVLPFVPDDAGQMARFITTNFRDFAIGIVNNQAVQSIKHEGLQAWFKDIAAGEGAVLPPGS